MLAELQVLYICHHYTKALSAIAQALATKVGSKTGFQAKNSRLAAVATTGRTNIWKLDTMVDIMTAYNGQPCIVPVSLTRSRC